MTDNAKTGIFVGAAAALGLFTWLTMPRQFSSIKDDSKALIGKPLFEKFTDPTVAATLDIIKYNDDLGELKEFKLARDKTSGAWVIPSHDSYAADAASQVSNVANSFIGLRVMTVESMKADDQKLYGVVEPDVSKLQVGDTGVGTLVKMQDEKGETLVHIIVGKTIRDDKKKRYVRRVGTDAIYSVDFDVTPITTEFSSWIEGDLLKLSANDIQGLIIRDYNILQTAGGPGQLSKNFDAELELSTKGATSWQAKSIKTFSNGKPTDRLLAEDEELNSVKINEIKSTLDNLKIVDVVRKPKGLAANLKADKELLDDNDKIMSLFKKGFVPGQRADGGMELYSSSGELAVKLNDGVEYLLRFGKSTADSEADAGATNGVALKRTLFVTARLDESFYPMPELQKVPETVEELLAIEAKEREADAAKKPAPDAPTGATELPLESKPSEDAKPKEAMKPADDAKPDAPVGNDSPNADSPKVDSPKVDSLKVDSPKVDVPKDEPAVLKDEPAAPKSDQSRLNLQKPSVKLVRFQAEDKPKSSGPSSPEAAGEVPKEKVSPVEKKPKGGKKAEKKEGDKPAAKASDNAKNADPAMKKEPSEAATTPEKKETEAKSEVAKPVAPDNKNPPAKDDKKPTAESAEEQKERLEAARENITKENTRKLDQRKDQMEKAKKKADELNARFAEWYYEIGDSEYKRLRASLDDLIKKKNAGASAQPPGGPQGEFQGGFPGAGGLPFNLPTGN